MPAITLPDRSLLPLTSRSVALLRRAIVERAADHGNIAKPSKLGPGILFVFCLLGASLGLLAWWLFIRRSGFIWREYDWAEYKSSVLRRPEERPDDAVTVFSDGTARKGGPMGSSVGARTVVLGELDTTYTKSYVAKEKPWGPRDLPGKGTTGGGSKGGGGLMGVWGKVEGSMWGKLRGGEPSDNDTVVQRAQSLRKSKHRSRRHKSKRERGERRPQPSGPAGRSYADDERPAPPLTDITRSSEASSSSQPPPPPRAPQPSARRPARVSTRSGKAPVKREPSYAVGDDRAAHYHQHRRTQSRRVVEESSSSEETSSSDSSSEDDSSDDESDLRSQIGMAKGNKVYHHPISQDRVFWGNARPVERNGGGAGGTFGGGAPALMPRGYRAGSVGSLSSEGSVRSSHVGT